MASQSKVKKKVFTGNENSKNLQKILQTEIKKSAVQFVRLSADVCQLKRVKI